MFRIKKNISLLLTLIFLVGSLQNGGVVLSAGNVENPYSIDFEKSEEGTMEDMEDGIEKDDLEELTEQENIDENLEEYSKEENEAKESKDKEQEDSNEAFDIDNNVLQSGLNIEEVEIPQEFTNIASSNAYYSSLTDKQKDDLFYYYIVRIDVMEILESEGYSISDSIEPAKVMQKLNIDFNTMQKTIETYGEFEKLSEAATLFVSYLYKYKNINTDYEHEMIDLLIRGYKTEDIFSAFIVAKALRMPVSQVIRDLDSVDKNELEDFSLEDKTILSTINNEFYIDIQVAIDYILQNEISVDELKTLIYASEYKNKRRDRSGIQTFATESEPGVIEYPSAAYTYDREKNEHINLNSGALIYKDPIISIPGINGLDLNLGLKYNSRESIGKKPASVVERMLVEVVPGFWDVITSVRFNYAEDYSYEINPFEQTGVGWSLDVDRINGDYLELSSGGSYQIIEVDGFLRLKDYLKDDLKILHASNGDYPDARHKLIDRNGTIKYFNGSGHLLVEIDKFGNKITYFFDNRDTLTIKDTRNNIIKLKTSTSGVEVTLPDEKKSTIQYKYSIIDDCHFLTEKRDQLNNPTYFEYSQEPQKAYYNGDWGSYYLKGIDVDYRNLEKVTHPTGLTTRYEYERLKGHFGKSYLDYYSVTSRYDLINYEKNNLVKYSYKNLYGELYSYYTEVNYSNGDYKYYNFDYKNYLVKDIRGSRDTTTYSYNYFLNLPSKIVYSLKGLATTQEYTYDNYGNVLTHNNGIHTISYTYHTDGRGFIMPETKNYAQDAKTNIEEKNEFMDDGNIKNSVVYVNGAPVSRIEYNYFTEGLLKDKGLLKDSTVYKDSGTKDDSKIKTEYTYDESHLFPTRKEIDNVKEEYIYDNMGKMLNLKDGNGNLTRFEYDLLGRQTKTINADDSMISNHYNDKDNIVTTTNENGAITIYTYDQLGNIKKVETKEAAGKSSKLIGTYTYDTSMRLKTESDPNNIVTVYNYDSYDRVRDKTVGSSLYKESYDYRDGYDATTSKVTKTIAGDANVSAIETVSYADRYGRLVKQGRMNGDKVILDIHSIVYDNLGNQLKALNALDQSTENKYDYAGRVIETKNPDGSVYKIEYDWLGRKISATDPKGLKEDYKSKFEYDNLGRVVEEKIPFQDSYYTIKKYSYDDNGNVLSEEISKNKPEESLKFTRTEYKYDNRNWLEKVTTFDNGKEENITEYKYDLVGNKREMKTANGTQITSYEYDFENRLKKIIYPEIKNVEEEETVHYQINYYVDSLSGENLLGDVKIVLPQESLGIMITLTEKELNHYLLSEMIDDYNNGAQVDGAVKFEEDGQIINVLYSKIEEVDITDFYYTINYYKDSVDSNNLIKSKKQLVSDTELEIIILLSDEELNFAYSSLPEGYLEGVQIDGESKFNKNGKIINVLYYKAEDAPTSMPYSAEFYVLDGAGSLHPEKYRLNRTYNYVGELGSKASANIDNYIFVETIMGKNKLIFSNVDIDTFKVSANPAKNVIRVYFAKEAAIDDDNDICYILRYYKDSVHTDNLIETNKGYTPAKNLGKRVYPTLAELDFAYALLPEGYGKGVQINRPEILEKDRQIINVVYSTPAVETNTTYTIEYYVTEKSKTLDPKDYSLYRKIEYETDARSSQTSWRTYMAFDIAAMSALGGYKYHVFSNVDIDTFEFSVDPSENIIKCYFSKSKPSKLASVQVDSISDKNTDAKTSKALHTQTTTTGENSRLSETYFYDINGNLKEKFDRNGNKTINTYDDLNRLIKVDATSPSGEAKEVIEYAYAKTGAKISEKNKNLVTTFGYDGFGRLVTQSESNGVVKTYTYSDLDSRLTFILKQGGVEKSNQEYTYDEMNRLETVSDKGVLSVTYFYNENGNREKLEYTNGTITTYEYNKANLVKSLTNYTDSSILSKFDYTYYLDGNQASKSDSIGRITTYLYDDLGRLTNETEKLEDALEFSKTYKYDKASNRSSMVVDGKEKYTTIYTYNSNNHLKKEVKNMLLSVETSEYIYDSNGNQISKSKYTVSSAPSNEEVGFYVIGKQRTTARENYTIELNEYDVSNRLIEVKNDEGTAIYAYKADGLRLSKDLNGKKTTHVWDGSNIALDYGAINDRYIRGINLIKSDSNGFYLYNAHGDVVQLTNSSGTVTKVYQYDAFGVEKDKDASDDNPFRYCGEYYDSSSGSYYLRNRYYNPSNGRFTSEDPIRSGINFYTYCNNNPLMFVDPYGLDAILVNKVVDNFIGIEHMSGFFQDENDDWFFFFWGPDVKYHQVTDTSIFESMDKMNEYLYSNNLYDKENKPYRDSVYIKGDFTESHKAAKILLQDYKDSLDSWNGKGLSNRQYNFFTNNCGHATMELFMKGILSSGTNVSDYMTSNGYGSAIIPNWNMINMQGIFYNKSTNIDGFNAGIKKQQDKYDGKNGITQWWYSGLKSNIDKIK